MKIVLAGSTGMIGHEVLCRCLEQASISSIVVLSRRPLPEVLMKDKRVTMVLMTDFAYYNESVLHHIQGASACIWYSLDNWTQ